MAEFIPVPPFDLVVFGATGDLSLRKLFPALLHRYLDGQIQPGSRIFGATRAEFFKLVRYVQLDGTAPVPAWKPLQQALGDGANVRIFYLATAPSLFAP